MPLFYIGPTVPDDCGFSIAVGDVYVAGLVSSIATSHAADLGGNCCADLEERVAEREATTTRKGNVIVSLKV